MEKVMNDLTLIELMNEYDALKQKLANVESAIKLHQKNKIREQLRTALAILEKIAEDNDFGCDDNYFSDDLDNYIDLTTIINCLGSFIEEVVK